MTDPDLFQVQTARIDVSIRLKLKKISGHRGVLFDHAHGVGQKKRFDGFWIIEFKTDQEFLLNDIVLDSVNDRNDEARFLFKKSLIGSVEISRNRVLLFGPTVDSELMSSCISFGEDFMEISVTQLLFVEAAYLCEHEIAIDNFAKFLLVSANYQNRRENSVVECVVAIILEFIVSKQLILIKFFRVCK
jgi:hypothetical protein